MKSSCPLRLVQQWIFPEFNVLNFFIKVILIVIAFPTQWEADWHVIPLHE
jgi:hypothetical protein